ncbi:hypothetical protein L226DRAFT_560191 [Lentinus tigrinus ALCF2SS1-7]|uniref:Uncharacterized protein n=1 Tax=Lentinus tigrinus ALCF2SS1-6 TaxID=1328759 RepID=A0A5C2SB42_9APHY|nr:hypothetical protein L227DRAFT_563010 [Lentinus tigrinus ALCF2SS1-6]RPD75047.1 hypothetical protein L226DRAFT_560191 [Lentinus tigrinus ALCF2SS1-7]
MNVSLRLPQGEDYRENVLFSLSNPSSVSLLGALLAILSLLGFASNLASTWLFLLITLSTTSVPYYLSIFALVFALLRHSSTVFTTQANKIRSLEAHLQAHQAEERRLRLYAIDRDQAVWRLLGKLDNARAKSSEQSDRIAALESGLCTAKMKLVDKDLALKEKDAVNLEQATTIRSLEVRAKERKTALLAACSSMANTDAALTETKADLHEAKDLIRQACFRIEDLEAQLDSANLQAVANDTVPEKALARVTAALKEESDSNQKLNAALIAKDNIISNIEIARNEVCLTSQAQGKTIEELVSKVKVLEEDRASHQEEFMRQNARIAVQDDELARKTAELDDTQAGIAQLKTEVETLSQQCDYLSNETIIRSWELTAQESRWHAQEEAMRKIIHDLCTILEEAGVLSSCNTVSTSDHTVRPDDLANGKKSRKKRDVKSRKQTWTVAADTVNINPCPTSSSWSSSASASTLAASPASAARSSATFDDPASPMSSASAAETNTSCRPSNSCTTLQDAQQDLGLLDDSLDIESLLGMIRLSVSSDMLLDIELNFPSWTALSPSTSLVA